MHYPERLEKAGPINTLPLFPGLNGQLIDLLKSLAPEEWSLPTICPGWQVKDVAAHLLDGNFRRIAIHRDNYTSPQKPKGPEYADLVDFLNQLNHDWVLATKRLSPAILIELIEQSNKQVFDCFSKLDPEAEAAFSVAWAGEAHSQNWFDIAREYTERWLHQQHIRLATQRPGLMEAKWYHPFIDTFLRGLPYTYRSTQAPEDTWIGISITGQGGGHWTLGQTKEQWVLFRGKHQQPDSRVVIDQEDAWKLFSKGIKDPETARSKVQIEGDPELGLPIINMVAIMG